MFVCEPHANETIRKKRKIFAQNKNCSSRFSSSFLSLAIRTTRNVVVSGQENRFREHIRSLSLLSLPLLVRVLRVRLEIFGLAIRHRDNARGIVLQLCGENTDRDGVVRRATDLLGGQQKPRKCYWE